jgi:hypothetical protein
VLVVVRIVAVVLALAGLAGLWWRRGKVRHALREFLFEPGTATALAVLRAYVFYNMLRGALRSDWVQYARMPSALWRFPPGWKWASPELFDPELVGALRYVLVAASACAMVGLWTRASASIAAFTALWVFSVQAFFGKINHGGHVHQLAALVLAFAPAGDALSIDYLWRRFRGYAPPPPSPAYTLPVRLCWLLLGTTYLFPGLWKLWESGDLWLRGEKLYSELVMRRSNPSPLKGNVRPPFHLEDYPALLMGLGAATLVFEIGFFFALFHRGARIVAAFSAVAFHLGVRQFMNIAFPVYLPLILLIDSPGLGVFLRRHLAVVGRLERTSWYERLASWSGPWTRRDAQGAALRPHPPRTVLPALMLGSLLLFGQLFTGAAGISSYPLSVYPRFSSRRATVPDRVASLRVVLENEGRGKSVELLPHLRRLGPARIANMLRPFADPKAPRRKQREQGDDLIELFRQKGIEVEPGDRIIVSDTSWVPFPPGERDDYREVVRRRYKIGRDGKASLEGKRRE